MGRKKSESISPDQKKEGQLSISLNEDVQFQDVTNGFEDYRFLHQACPDVDLDRLDLSVPFLGKRLSAPLMISSMVGGVESARVINRNLARAAQKLGLALGLGSARCWLESPDVASTFQVRDIAPDILLFANLGAVQLNYGFGVNECLRAVQAVKADALCLHLNPLQEALQAGGNTDFRGLIGKIKTICANLPVPVVVKEVGCGISAETASRLLEAGISGIDVAGAGGTCWSKIEHKCARDTMVQNMAHHFYSWGIPTAQSLVMVRRVSSDLPVIASGGIRNGIEVAKAIALGADVAGMALPLLEPATRSAGRVVNHLLEIIMALKITMFCVGAARISDLRYSPLLVKNG